MTHPPLTLDRLPGRFAVCRLDPGAAAPAWAAGAFVAVVRTPDELSVVCAEDAAPADVRAERGWAGLKVRGPLPFTQVGVLASLAGPLAAAGVSLFAVSTFGTDYVLVKEADLPRAVEALRRCGHEVG